MCDQPDSTTPEITSGTKLSVLRKVASSPLLDHTAEVLGAKCNWPKAKIICTIGPASRDPENLARLYECGMRCMRLNFSHGSYEYHAGSVANLRSIMAGSKRACSIMLDTKGPEIRTGKVKGGNVNLRQGQKVILTWDEKFKEVEFDGSDGGKLYHDYTRITDSLVVGDICLVDDGLIGLEVISVEGNDLVTRVRNDGELGNTKGCNLPGKPVYLPAVCEKDIQDIMFGVQQGVDFIALSFVRTAADVALIKELLAEQGAPQIQVISKIESQQGLDNFDEILEVSDGIMVARGDLGVEIPLPKVFLAQKMMLEKCNAAGKIIIVATQMLETMIKNPRPTRAEVTDVANAVCDGADCVMLSGETAKGAWPFECVTMMNNICIEAESSLDYRALFKKQVYHTKSRVEPLSILESVCSSAVKTSLDLKCKLIVTFSDTGRTARCISKFHPAAPVIVITSDEQVARQCCLKRGLFPKIVPRLDSSDSMAHYKTIRAYIDKLLQQKTKVNLQKGDPIICIYSSQVGVSGSTNMMHVIEA